VKVILVGATTICGRISPAGYGSLLDRRRLEETRDKTGASIIGANTLRTENPEMRGTNGTLSQDRIRAVISRRGLIPVTDKKLFDHGPQPVVFTGEDNLSGLQERLKGKARVISLPEGPYGLSLRAALDFFTGRDVESVLIEGGAQLNYAALAEGVVDEILLTIIPYVSGEHGSTAFADGPKHLGEPFLELELLSSEAVSTGELFLHYRIKSIE
jgi:2,5-diamino-6-(ribosylamino)-4(3H)-pyrimidinone 5'-phosphate reductase